MTPAASHPNYHIAEQILQPYLQEIFNWTKSNGLILNPDKSTATLFTSDTHEHDVTLNLTINKVTIPTVKNPKILGLTFDPALTFTEHARITKTKADSSIKIPKALTSTSWGKQKETLLATYKTIILPVIEYASTVWYLIISDTNLKNCRPPKTVLAKKESSQAAHQIPTHSTSIRKPKHFHCPTTSNSTLHNSDKSLSFPHTPYTTSPSSQSVPGRRNKPYLMTGARKLSPSATATPSLSHLKPYLKTSRQYTPQ